MNPLFILSSTYLLLGGPICKYYTHWAERTIFCLSQFLCAIEVRSHGRSQCGYLLEGGLRSAPPPRYRSWALQLPACPARPRTTSPGVPRAPPRPGSIRVPALLRATRRHYGAAAAAEPGPRRRRGAVGCLCGADRAGGRQSRAPRGSVSSFFSSSPGAPQARPGLPRPSPGSSGAPRRCRHEGGRDRAAPPPPVPPAGHEPGPPPAPPAPVVPPHPGPPLARRGAR